MIFEEKMRLFYSGIISVWIFGFSVSAFSAPRQFSSGPETLFRGPISDLNAENFSQTINSETKATIVLFYLSWCGHCRAFAPTYQQFAENLDSSKKKISNLQILHFFNKFHKIFQAGPNV